MSNRETLNQQKPDLPSPGVLSPNDDETLLPGEFTAEKDESQDPDQADLIPKVGAEAEEGVEEEDTDADDDADADDTDDADDADDADEEDGEVEEGSGAHV